MWIANTINKLHEHRAAIAGPVAFVPTMGALHRGHLSLVERAKELAPNVIVSIFVNPTQFGPNEDFNRYPRPIENDLKLCADAGVHGVFNPDVNEMYRVGQLACDVRVPELATILEGAIRPGHFDGVCRVVAKLFNLVQPQFACFGMKDYQQLQIIRAMVDDLCMNVRVVPCLTLREHDGLAMSSRNVYLTPDERLHAVGLFKALSEARMLVETAGEIDPGVIERVMMQVMRAHHIEPDYAVVRHPHTLTPMDSVAPKLTAGVAALVAGKLGQVRLIDNMLLGVPAATKS